MPSSIVQSEFVFENKKTPKTSSENIHRANMITGTIAYKKYGMPRSMLRSLVEQGVVRMEEKSTGGPYVLKLYHQGDIESYLNGK